MMKYIFLVILIITSSSVVGQVKPKDLIGSWITCNDDSVYYRSDKLVFHQDINHRTYEEKPCCYNVNWNISSGRKINIEELFSCTEPGRIKTIHEKSIFKLTGKKEQVLTLKSDSKGVERFKIIKFEVLNVNRYPYEIKVMTLKRL